MAEQENRVPQQPVRAEGAGNAGSLKVVVKANLDEFYEALRNASERLAQAADLVADAEAILEHLPQIKERFRQNTCSRSGTVPGPTA